jgi:hypothetical protein
MDGARSELTSVEVATWASIDTAAKPELGLELEEKPTAGYWSMVGARKFPNREDATASEQLQVTGGRPASWTRARAWQGNKISERESRDR